MSKSFALLTMAAFALSAPINARTLPATDEAEHSIEMGKIDGDRPECHKAPAEEQRAAEMTGAMPDTSAAPAEAATASCCLIYWNGRWWCVLC